MKYKYLVLIALVLSFLSCSNEEIKGDYAGLSELDTLILEFENDLVPLEKEVTELSVLTSYLLKNKHRFIMEQIGASLLPVNRVYFIILLQNLMNLLSISLLNRQIEMKQSIWYMQPNYWTPLFLK